MRRRLGKQASRDLRKNFQIELTFIYFARSAETRIFKMIYLSIDSGLLFAIYSTFYLFNERILSRDYDNNVLQTNIIRFIYYVVKNMFSKAKHEILN